MIAANADCSHAAPRIDKAQTNAGLFGGNHSWNLCQMFDVFFLKRVFYAYKLVYNHQHKIIYIYYIYYEAELVRPIYYNTWIWSKQM